jgi:hypothetical protein
MWLSQSYAVSGFPLVSVNRTVFILITEQRVDPNPEFSRKFVVRREPQDRRKRRRSFICD